MRGRVKASINIQLVRIELVISVNNEQTGMDHIASAPTTHSVTQVGHTVKSAVV